MHPAGAPPPQNRCCPSPSPAQCSSPSPPLLQQQQQHVIYGPITTLQPCSANMHPPHCVYSGVQRNPGLTGNSGSLLNQVPNRHAKMTKWQPKSKLTRSHHPNHHQQSHQQYCQPFQHQQTHVQQPLPYIPKPLVLFDQCQANQATPGVPPSAASFLVASSTFTHGPYAPGDHYTAGSGLTLIPQPYFKPPDVSQAFCLLPERPQAVHHHQHNFGGHTQGSYYNISATNACNLQAINSKPSYNIKDVTSFYGNGGTFENNQIPSGQPAPTRQIFQNSPATYGTPSRDRMLSNVDAQAMTCSRNLNIPEDMKYEDSSTARAENIDWLIHTPREASNNIFETACALSSPKTPVSPIKTNQLCSSTITKNQDERYSDESAASFDFTIEAEKMVSALCNTVSLNELGKDEIRGRNETSPSFGGAAGDNVANKTNMWFADFCTEYGVSVGQSNRTASTQTHEDRRDPQSYPEIIKKTIYLGCNEAETILNSSSHRSSSKAAWLANIAFATRTALTKSSTCFPIFSGDRAFILDLINALLRISNGWLVLDNYLNKQHYPSLDVKFDRELTSRFQIWEVVTQDLLKELVKTFVNLEENSGANCSTNLENLGFQEHPSNTSFPGDVNLYTNNNLFESSQFQTEHSSKLNDYDRDSTYAVQHPLRSANNSNFPTPESRQQSQKETKLRSKWTITENLSSTVDGAKSIRDNNLAQNDVGFPINNRFRVKNSSNTSTTKITSSSRQSLNAEFFHLQNKVMESMGNSSETERRRWGLKEQQYNLVFGTSRGPNRSAIVPDSYEPIFKFKNAGSSYENAYTRRCPPRVDLSSPVNQTTMTHCANVNGSVYLVAGTEAGLNSTYIAGIGSTDHNKTYTEPDYTSNVRIAELNEHSCGNGIVVSATSISSIRTEPVYVGKCSSDQRELAAVPRTKMTLLSQIEGNTPVANRETKEMTANLSAWFASMRNSNGHRTINCPIEGRKNENAPTARTSTHPQETSRSAMDLSRQLYMDGNRQLQTLQNMQAIQSQPWNAANLLNNKRTTANVHRGLDEYDSSEDVRVYMKPGSYNVPKKRHHRKNSRRTDHPTSSRANINNNNTPRPHSNRAVQGGIYNSGVKNHQVSTSVSSLLIASSVQVSTTTTTTSTSIRVPFPATPIVPPPSNFTSRNSPRILRRAEPVSDHETQQDVAWKAACASAEILLEALNVKSSNKTHHSNSKSPISMKFTEKPSTPKNRDEQSVDRSTGSNENINEADKDIFCDASSYEESEDDSSSACKFSPDRHAEPKSRDVKQTKTNVKTDTWLIRTFNNASMVSSINPRESDRESTVGESMNSSIQEDRHEYKSVVTSTPEPAKTTTNVNADESTTVSGTFGGSFQKKIITESPRESAHMEQTGSNNFGTPSKNLSISLIDTSTEFVGRATYSETVRRSTGKSFASGKGESCRSRQTRSTGSIESTVRSTIVPIPGRKCQRRDNDRGHQSVHKSRKTIAKRISRHLSEKESEEGRSNKKLSKEDTSVNNSVRPLVIKCHSKKKDNSGSCGGWAETKTKISERGWSVWYSSRRKQTLSTLALNKLATIHQTVWQMDDAKLLKHPSAISNGSGGPTEMIDDDRKVNKSPIFLETIGYKLKNRIYHKIEHVIRDFRKIFNHSKLYHKNDTDRIARIETLSKKLEELFDEHFANWEFENPSESPKNSTGLSNALAARCKSPRQRQKSPSCRLSSSAKKNSTTSTKNEH